VWRYIPSPTPDDDLPSSTAKQKSGRSKMPKLKTHKSTAKRFKRTGTGKLMRQNMPKGHLRRRHSKRNNRKLDRYVEVALHEQKKKINQLAPYIK
jgi:large subunit ribosomal protein L35